MTSVSRVAATLALALGIALTASPAWGSTVIAVGTDDAGDVKILGPKKSGPSMKARRTIDIRRSEVVDNGATRTLKIKVKKLATGRFGGWHQLFYMNSYTADGTSVATAGFTHRPKLGGWGYSEVRGESCEFTKIRRAKKTNTITATVPASCFPVPSGGRIRVSTMVGTYRSDEPSYASDGARVMVNANW